MNLDLLVRRSAIVKAVRAFFEARDFLEVETPVRLAAPAPECHIDCPPVATGGYLRASPELQMKKLLAAGLDRIYTIGPCFRDGERGARHNPEFTMIEWYRRHATYLDIAADLKALMAELGRRAGLADLPFREVKVRDAYLQYAGWDPWTGWDQDRFDVDMATVIEPKLKELGGGVFLMDYPVHTAALARIVTSAGTTCRPPPAAYLPYAERWEFYWNGMELANCFGELCDADEQRRRFIAAKAARRALDEADYPLDEEFFRALPQIGAAAGVALGIDRLVMVLTGAKDISAVRVGC
ncbi:MAG: amino acid--tRNA ligase-related protein [Kiritimatiellia bacterium]